MIENEALRKELAQYKEQLTTANQQLSALSDENTKLKNSLYEQIYNEKIAILNSVTKKTDVYYISSINGELNRLKAFEMESINRIDMITSSLTQMRVDGKDEIFSRINELRQLLDSKLNEARSFYNEQTGAYSKNRELEYQKLREEGISQEEISRALKKNNIESLIGLNIINKLGILLLIIGTIALTQFTYLRLPDIMKTIFVFIGGAVLLVVGELLNRKKPNVFSLGLTSGGVAVLYVAIAVSYFGLKNISMYVALALCIIITMLSFYLSQRYESQTIAAFTMIGGYLPILSIANSEILVYSAMVYFLILNLFLLIIAFKRKWSIAPVIGFVLNLLGTAYIMLLAIFSSGIQSDVYSLKDFITIVYILLAFLIYTIIPIAGTYFDKKTITSYDTALIAVNTYISTIFMYYAFYNTAFVPFVGALAIIFAAIYFLLTKFMEKKLPDEVRVRSLFFTTSLVFVVLFIPIQFGIVWLSLGWLIEGVLFISYGILKDDKKLRKYGYIIFALCLGIFYSYDVLAKLLNANYYFGYKYLAITLGSLVVMATYIYKKTLVSKTVNLFKCFTYLNLWFFIIYMITGELRNLLAPQFRNSSINISYLLNILSIACGFLLAYVVPRIRLLLDRGVKSISVFIYISSILGLMITDTVSSPVTSNDITLGISILGTVILILINLMSVLAMMDLVKGFVLDRKFGTEWYPLLVSIYLVIILTQNLIIQYELDFTNFAISIIYILLAFSWIVFGFIKRYSFIRRFGLGLSFLAMAKLFLLDLSILTEGYRIISYFAFGIILIAISFVYQYFNKKLEVKLPPL